MFLHSSKDGQDSNGKAESFVSLLGGRHHSSCATAAALMQAARRLCEGDDHGRIDGAPFARKARIYEDAVASCDFRR
jgi:hypothetical protein